MADYRLSIKKSDCIGCHSCEVACKQEHGLDIGPRLIHVIEKSPDFLPVYCHQCAKAPCVDSCPTKAISRNKDGLVLIDEKECIGCRECIDACPFGAMQFSDDKAVAIKCDLCFDRITKGLKPACVTICPTGCITFRDKREHPWELPIAGP
jgi:Fe-S-cluster-containing dehydrogenase component